MNAIAAQKRDKTKSQLLDYWHFYEHYIVPISNEVLHEAANSSDAQGAVNDFCKT
ncbi:MAG: hypothetical protein Q4F54_04340 [Coriobacteriia bacterium]|nr:hypothetical protein [Coriobacteriia bacterium]